MYCDQTNYASRSCCFWISIMRCILLHPPSTLRLLSLTLVSVCARTIQRCRVCAFLELLEISAILWRLHRVIGRRCVRCQFLCPSKIVTRQSFIEKWRKLTRTPRLPINDGGTNMEEWKWERWFIVMGSCSNSYYTHPDFIFARFAQWNVLDRFVEMFWRKRAVSYLTWFPARNPLHRRLTLWQRIYEFYYYRHEKVEIESGYCLRRC